LLLAQADSDRQQPTPTACRPSPTARGRVGFFLPVDDFDVAHARMRASRVQFVTEPRDEPYRRVAVFDDIAGNRWDLLGPSS